MTRVLHVLDHFPAGLHSGYTFRTHRAILKAQQGHGLEGPCAGLLDSAIT